MTTRKRKKIRRVKKFTRKQKFTRKHFVISGGGVSDSVSDSVSGGSSDGGVYCYMPYNSLDTHDKSTFKIESCTSIKEHLKKMKKFFPTGFYVIAILKKPNVGLTKIKNKKIYYQLIKDKIIEITMIGGGVINKENDDGGWVYCTIDNIHDAFKDAEKMYGGEREEFSLTGKINDTMKLVDIENTKKPIYVGKVIFHT